MAFNPNADGYVMDITLVKLEEPIDILIAEYNPSDEDQDWEIDWEDCLTNIQGWIKEQKQDYMYAWINNFGWRKASGHQVLKLVDAQKLLSDILPKTDCIFKVYRNDSPLSTYKLKIVNYHHDAPTGETYYLRFLTDIELEELE